MKKIISMILAVAMLITFMAPVVASSSTSTDKGLENAIKAVKAKIDIPKECTKFTYDINNYNGINSWNLGWSSEDTQKYIYVTIDENNLITRYNTYDNDKGSYEKKIPKFTKGQGLDIAEKFITKLDTKLLSQFKLIERTNSYLSDREYIFNYVRQVNGIDYNQNSISIYINKYTGLVTEYSCNYNKNVNFEDASKIINLEQAKKAFADKLGLKLAYLTKNENDKLVTYLAYIPKNAHKYIDALTGEVETGYDYYYGNMVEKTMSADIKGDSGYIRSQVNLTPDELEAVKGMTDILSREDADKKIRAINLLNLDDQFKLTEAYLNKSYRQSDSFTWFLYYTKVINKDTNESRTVSVSIDAKSGEIENFSTNYSAAKDAKPQKTREQAKLICEDTLKSLIPSKYAKLKYDETFDNNSEYYAKYEEAQNQFTFRYVRMENGIECPNNYINISYDNLSGNVVYLYSNWDKDLKFDAPKDIIPIDKANEVLFNKIGYNVQYINDLTNSTSNAEPSEQVDTYKAVLGYFINSTIPNIISAKTGGILNNSGEVYKQTNAISDYTDIKGLKSENQIKILTQMSIKYFESELKPNDSLLQKDYFLLLAKLNDTFYFDQNLTDDKIIENMYNSLISQGIITKAEKAPLSTITRETAAKYFIKFLGLEKIAQLKGIYKADFKDANKINPELLGYVCLASGMKAMNGSNGYLNPKAKMTRLEGLLSIYSYLSNK